MVVSGNKWTFKGVATPPKVDRYDFDTNVKRTTSAAAAVYGQNAFEGFLRYESVGIIRPKAYDNQLEGSIEINESGTF